MTQKLKTKNGQKLPKKVQALKRSGGRKARPKRETGALGNVWAWVEAVAGAADDKAAGEGAGGAAGGSLWDEEAVNVAGGNTAGGEMVGAAGGKTSDEESLEESQVSGADITGFNRSIETVQG